MFQLEEEDLLQDAATAIDFSRNSIRFYKDAWHKIGEPKFVRFLINPERRLVGISAAEKDQPNDQTYRINERIMRQSTSSYEIHSSTLTRKIREEIGIKVDNGTYRMSGKIIPNHRLAIFHLDTLKHTED